MHRYFRYLGPEKLKWAIWCELFVIHEGYIPYLKKWNQLQDSPKTDIKADQRGGEIHSDIQCLVPGGPLKVGDSQEVAKLGDATQPFGERS